MALEDHLADLSNPHQVTKAQLGLGNCDNTSDANKPISTAAQTALDLRANVSITANLRADLTTLDEETTAALALKASTSSLDSLTSTVSDHTSDLTNPHEVTKTQLALGNVDNTSDANKPISTAVQTALNLKATTAALANLQEEVDTLESDVTSALGLKAAGSTLSSLTSTVSDHTSDLTNPHEVTKAQIGLGNCDNTSDASKPISTATQVALNLKTALSVTANLRDDFDTLRTEYDTHIDTGGAGVTDHGGLTGLEDDDHTQYHTNARGDARYPLIADLTGHTGNTSNPHSVTKTQLGLGNCDNTSDANKPVSTAQQTALDLKATTASLSSHTGNTSNPHSVTKTQVGLGSADDTADTAKPVSTLQQAALDLKANLASPTGTGTWTLPLVNQVAGSNIASAGTTNLASATGNAVTITGTTTITAFGTVAAGAERILTFASALVLTYNATSLILPTAASITTAAGDVARMLSLGSGNWKCVGYTRASGAPLVAASVTTPNVIYVTTGGHDTNGNGSLTAPYLTAQKGFQEAIALATTCVIDFGVGNFGNVALSSAALPVISLRGKGYQTVIGTISGSVSGNVTLIGGGFNQITVGAITLTKDAAATGVSGTDGESESETGGSGGPGTPGGTFQVELYSLRTGSVSATPAQGGAGGPGGSGAAASGVGGSGGNGAAGGVTTLTIHDCYISGAVTAPGVVGGAAGGGGSGPGGSGSPGTGGDSSNGGIITLKRTQVTGSTSAPLATGGPGADGTAHGSLAATDSRIGAVSSMGSTTFDQSVTNGTVTSTTVAASRSKISSINGGTSNTTFCEIGSDTSAANHTAVIIGGAFSPSIP